MLRSADVDSKNALIENLFRQTLSHTTTSTEIEQCFEFIIWTAYDASDHESYYINFEKGLPNSRVDIMLSGHIIACSKETFVFYALLYDSIAGYVFNNRIDFS